MIWNFRLHGNRWFGITIHKMFIGVVFGTPTMKAEASGVSPAPQEK